jgi:hypothetical protein
MPRQKNILLLAILVGIAGMIIGGITLFSSITNIAKP